jgi:hypothetical protein
VLLELPGSKQNRIDDMLVACATTQVSGNRLANFRLGGIWILLKEASKGHEETWGAEATLEPVCFPESFLKRAEIVCGGHPIRRQRLDRGQFVSVGLDGKDYAGSNWSAVKEYRASSTYALFAAYVRAGQIQFVTQKVAQQKAWLNLPFVDFSIYGDFHCIGLCHTSPIKRCRRRIS